MEFKHGAQVYSSDGRHIGNLDRVVLDPQNDQVTDLIIRKGHFFGEDKVVPISIVKDASDDHVTLSLSEGNLPALREFEDRYYIPAGPQDFHKEFTPAEGYPSASVYGYPPLGTAWWGLSYDVGYPPIAIDPAYREQVQENIPDGTVAIREGARVLSQDGEHVGNVEEIFTDANTNHATHLVISQGLIFKERKLIPTNWIKLAGEDDLILTVKTGVVTELPAYKS